MTAAMIPTPSRTISNAAYSLTYTDGLPTACTCPGCAYRGHCRHITEHANGGFEVYCYGCETIHLRAVRHDAARAWVRGQDRCNYCRRRATLCVVPDWDARDALRTRDEISTGGVAGARPGA